MFETAFNFVMQSEVGPWFDSTDPDVIAGLCKTVVQKKKTGFVNHKSDKGGATKFGIAQASHPQVDVMTLTLAQAKAIYFKAYWKVGRCDELPEPMCIAHFDACVNHGISRAGKLLQLAVGAQPDGVVGANTIAHARAMSVTMTPEQFMKPRRDFFLKIVEARPDQEVFLKGWLARCDHVESILR